MGERCFMCRQEFSKLKGNFRVSVAHVQGSVYYLSLDTLWILIV